jgi:plasmid stability protein
MKTTLDLPDELMREIKVRAASEDRRLKDLVAELLRRGLKASEEREVIRHRVKLPLIRGGHPAKPGEELTPERVDQILADEEAERVIPKR